MSEWIRKSFTGAGLTQSPPGPYFKALQEKMSGTVMLCIDVSSSMTGEPLRQAIAGATTFFGEAREAGYRPGLILWNHGVFKYVPDSSYDKVLRSVKAAHASGGTDLVPALRVCIEFFAERTGGDRVLCIFGDGDVGDRTEAKRLARELCAMGVRIVVRGLGRGAQEALSELVCPGEKDDAQLIEDVGGIVAGIASMATGLIRRYD